MKKLCLFLSILFLLPAAVRGQKELTTVSKVTQATVYLEGAEVVQAASVQLQSGANKVVITNICRHIDPSSIRIKATGGALVSSHEFLTDYLTKREDNPRIKMLSDSIEIYEKRERENNIEVSVNNDMVEMLKTGIQKNVSGSEQGLGIDDLVKTMDYYSTKSAELQAVKTRLDTEKKEIADRLTRLRTQVKMEQGLGTDYDAVIKLDLTVPVARSVEFTVTYHTQLAGWTPVYDVNVTDTDRPVQFAMRARVWQRTGLDWNDIDLTLSTSNPTYGKIAPEYSAWLLQNRQDIVVRGLSGKVAGIQPEQQLEEVVVVGYGTQTKRNLTGGISATASSEPIYVLNGEAINSAQFQNLDPKMIDRINVLKGSDATSIYGSRASSGVVEVFTKTSMSDFVQGSETVNSVAYTIDRAYTLPTGNQPRVLDLRNFSVPADFKYYTAPKLDQETYVIAEIRDWNALELIAGKANITFDGTYIGETVIDPATLNEKLTLTLGVDKRVSVRREKISAGSSSRFLGSDVQQTLAYRTTVRNNLNRLVNIVVTDQYPLSIDDNITVNINSKESTPWTSEDEAKGVVSWEGTFDPGQVRTFELHYTVRYPKTYKLGL